jgi:hypothetical protein
LHNTHIDTSKLQNIKIKFISIEFLDIQNSQKKKLLKL